MNTITIHRETDTKVTLVQNRFIDQYMPKANGEYVKLYLYLLRLHQEGRPFSLEHTADLFEHTENDIRRALSYWEKQGLVLLKKDGKGQITDISLLEPGEPKSAAAPPVLSVPETAAASEKQKPSLTADRIAALKNQEEIEQLLFIASQYLGKTLSPTEISNILYFYDTLHFSTDLIEYLIEYCVSKGSKSARYMEKVALEWSKEGVSTVEDAKKGSSLYHRKYYSALNAFGIKGRGPSQSEMEYVDRWTNEFHFTSAIIAEACDRTITQTHQPNFAYANRILEEWHKKGIRHLEDIKQLDLAFMKKKKAAQASPKTAQNNKFHNFHQRDYDFDKLEKQLLNS